MHPCSPESNGAGDIGRRLEELLGGTRKSFLRCRSDYLHVAVVDWWYVILPFGIMANSSNSKTENIPKRRESIGNLHP